MVTFRKVLPTLLAVVLLCAFAADAMAAYEYNYTIMRGGTGISGTIATKGEAVGDQNLFESKFRSSIESLEEKLGEDFVGRIVGWMMCRRRMIKLVSCLHWAERCIRKVCLKLRWNRWKGQRSRTMQPL